MKLRDTERYLDAANVHSNRAADNTDQLKQLNRSIFLPVWNKNKKKYEVPEVPEQNNHNRRKEPDDNLIGGNSLVGGRMKTEQRSRDKRYQFETTASDDDMEDEMEDNLNEISETTKRLKALGVAMGDELDHQNGWIDNIAGKTDRLDDKLRVNTDRVRCYFKIDVDLHLMFFPLLSSRKLNRFADTHDDNLWTYAYS